jgi:hypothetical protein
LVAQLITCLNFLTFSRVSAQSATRLKHGELPFQGGLPDLVATGSLNYLQRAGQTVYGVFTPLERDILLNLKKDVVLTHLLITEGGPFTTLAKNPLENVADRHAL